MFYDDSHAYRANTTAFPGSTAASSPSWTTRGQSEPRMTNLTVSALSSGTDLAAAPTTTWNVLCVGAYTGYIATVLRPSDIDRPIRFSGRGRIFRKRANNNAECCCVRGGAVLRPIDTDQPILTDRYGPVDADRLVRF